VLVDIRAESQRAADGTVPAALFIPRNVLEWRCDPTSSHPDERIGAGRRVVVICDVGYASSLAAAKLRDLGVDATDLDGGFQAWRAAGLPVHQGDA
jgi:rhodanese-related sulfurtransferase